MAVLLLECFNERLYRFVLVGVMRAEVRVVERFCTGDNRDLRVIPAVRAEDWGRDAELAGLLDDLADFFIEYLRSEERRVWKEFRSRWSPYH